MANEILDNYVGMDEVSRRLGIHIESARRLARQGKLEAQRVGNKWLVRKDVLDPKWDPASQNLLDKERWG